jgi:hypothetical protein
VARRDLDDAAHGGAAADARRQISRWRGGAGFDHFLGPEADLIRDTRGVAKVVELDGDEVGYRVGRMAEINRIAEGRMVEPYDKSDFWKYRDLRTISRFGPSPYATSCAGQEYCGAWPTDLRYR